MVLEIEDDDDVFIILCVWVQINAKGSCDPGGASDGSRLATYYQRKPPRASTVPLLV